MKREVENRKSRSRLAAMMGAVIAAGALTASCGQGETRKFDKPGYSPPGAHGAAKAAAVPEPKMAPFEGCAWGLVTGAGVSIWSQTCPNQRLVADEATKALMLETLVDGAASRSEAIRVLTIPEGGMAALAAQLMAEGKAPAGATCALEPATTQPVEAVEGVTRYSLTPIGAAKAVWDKAVTSDVAPEVQPCGAYGVGIVGDRLIEVHAGHPGQAVFIEYGSEIQIYDPTTLRFAGGPASKEGGH